MFQVCAPRHKADESTPVEKNDGQNSAELDGHLKTRGFVADEAKQIADDDQMSGRRYRNKLGNTFDDPQQNRNAKIFQLKSSRAKFVQRRAHLRAHFTLRNLMMPGNKDRKMTMA